MTEYVVTRTNWRRLPDGTFRLPGTVPVARFDTPNEAEAERARREEDARRELKPFALGDHPSDVCSLPLFALADWLTENGFDPPAPDVKTAEWASWWNSLDPAAAAARVGPVFDRLWPMYAIEPQPATALFAQVALQYAFLVAGHGEPNRWCLAEGGGGLQLYRSEPTGLVRTETVSGDWEPPIYNVSARARAESDLLVRVPLDYRTREDPRGIPADAVYRVPFHGLQADRRPEVGLFIVCRVGWDPGWDVLSELRVWSEAGQRPLAVHPTRAAAEADAWNRELAGRRDVNPFRFGTPDRLSSLGSFRYASMLRELDVVAAGRSDSPYRDWDQLALVEWHAAVGPHLTDAQRAEVWDLLDQLRLYQVLELPLLD